MSETSLPERVLANAPYAVARPVLSVLIPYKNDDPTDLLGSLDREAAKLSDSVEVVIVDDGSCDPELTGRIEQLLTELRLPICSIRMGRNEGRARTRNRLAAWARGGAFLFLDADMRPDDDRFLAAWADLVAREDPAVAFGGVSLKQASRARELQVHRRMAQTAECTPFYVRALRPEKYVYTSNLLVRRDAFQSEDFDDGFSGWGWEDVEWAMRVARRYRVLHVDIPASHLGLDTAERLAAKYEQSVANFARVVERHPEVVSLYPSYRAARLLKKAPARHAWRPLLKQLALAPVLPIKARAFSLRLYRAALYAEAV